MFKQWLSQMHYPSVGAFNDSICYDAKKCNPAVHYYSNLYVDAYGLSVLSGATKTITTALKNAVRPINFIESISRFSRLNCFFNRASAPTTRPSPTARTAAIRSSPTGVRAIMMLLKSRHPSTCLRSAFELNHR